MPDADPIAPYAAMKAAGAAPGQVGASALDAGVGKLEAIRILRSLYALPFREADEILRALEGPQSPQALYKYLEERLGYCACASSNALLLLRDLLRAVRDRSDGASDPEVWASSSQRIEHLLHFDKQTGLNEWFVYFLESRGLLCHGFRINDLYILEEGRRLLRAIERFENPTPFETTDDTGVSSDQDTSP